MPQSKQKKAPKKKETLLKQKTAGNLRKHFGKLKLGMDGLTFQKKVRSEWD